MAIGVIEIDAAAAVVSVDLAGALLERIGPVRETSCANAPEDAVEVLLVDQERVVMGNDIRIADVDETQKCAVLELNIQDGAKGARGGETENVGEESCGGLLVAGVDERMVETNTHGNSPRCRRGGRRPAETLASLQS